MRKLSFKIFLVSAILLLSACAQLPTDFDAPASYVISNTEDTALGKISKEKLVNAGNESKMILIDDGVNAFVARASLLYAAEKTIDVQYYIWHADLVGKILFNGLIAAADRGVRVRVLLDDMPVDKETETILYAMDQHQNIEVRLFNPFATRDFRYVTYLVSPKRINHRMHNKSFTVDNQHTIIGGRNIGDEYFSAHENSNFKDIDVLAIGPIVKEVGSHFDLYWNSKVVYPVTAFDHNKSSEKSLQKVAASLQKFVDSKKNSKYHQDVQNSEMYKGIKRDQLPESPFYKVFQGIVHVIYDDPRKGLGKTEQEVTYLKYLIEPYVENINKTFELISPYFVPGEEGVNYLTSMVDKGIKVRVVTNSLSSTDGLMAQSGYSRRRHDLLVGGVELYEFKSSFKTSVSKSLRRGEKAKSALHAKVYIFDREQVFIGSFNFDPRSSNINSEVGVVYEVAEMANLIATTVFDENIKQATYRVMIADKDMQIGDVEIDEGEVYWVESIDDKKHYYSTEPKTGFWRRFGQDFLSIMPIESQL